MPKSQNRVIEGYGKGCEIRSDLTNSYIYFNPLLASQTIKLNKECVSQYDMLTEDKVKSASSAILRGMGGTLLLGGVGILAGLSAKSKGIYLIAVEYKNNQRSLIEIDDKLYKIFIRSNF